MSWKIISPRCARESATTLQTYLNEMYPKESTTIINWGNGYIGSTDNSLVFGNKTAAVSRSSNKQTFFNLCESLGTVPVVTSYPGPCYQHHANLQDGRGVKFVDKEEDFVSGILTTQRVEGVEFRAYFCYNAPIAIYKKVPLTTATPEAAIQNTVNNYGYESNPKELRTIENLDYIIRTYTHKTANKLELSMGAVDFIVENDTYNVFLLESNSAPCLFNYDLVEMFATAINKTLWEG